MTTNEGPLLLSDCQYLQGFVDPVIRRRVEPGDRAVLHVTAEAIIVETATVKVSLAWPGVTYLDVRGPTEPEVAFRSNARLRFGEGWRTGMGRKYSWCYLAVGQKNDPEVIFKISGMVGPQLEALLERHARRGS